MNVIPSIRPLLTALACVLALAGAGVPGARAQGAAEPESVATTPAAPVDTAVTRETPRDTVRTEGVDYLWVLRNSLVDPADIPRLVERAKAMHVRGLLVQVVGRGDGWYRSDLLPYPEPLRTRGRDPLGELVPLAHAAGLEVHAWVNCCLVWSGPRPPRDPRHVLNAHPEWIARMADGRPMTRLSEQARQKLMVEGVFLSPSHPGVRHWIADITREIASRYPVDGIHLDYIREPSVAIGFDPTSRARFAMEHGVDPARFDRLPPAQRASMDSAWAEFHEAQVTAIVREVRDSLDAVRPGLALSAAVLADQQTAVRRNHQAWSEWLRDGLLDRAYAMCYAPSPQTVLTQLVGMASQVDPRRLVPGIAVYNTSPSIAAAKIKAARELGFPTIALYSYDSLWERADLWDRLRGFLNGPTSMEEQP